MLLLRSGHSHVAGTSPYFCFLNWTSYSKADNCWESDGTALSAPPPHHKTGTHPGLSRGLSFPRVKEKWREKPHVWPRQFGKRVRRRRPTGSRRPSRSPLRFGGCMSLVCRLFIWIKFLLLLHPRLGTPVGVRRMAAPCVDSVTHELVCRDDNVPCRKADLTSSLAARRGPVVWPALRERAVSRNFEWDFSDNVVEKRGGPLYILSAGSLPRIRMRCLELEQEAQAMADGRQQKGLRWRLQATKSPLDCRPFGCFLMREKQTFLLPVALFFFVICSQINS